MYDPVSAAQSVSVFLRLLLSSGHLELQHTTTLQPGEIPEIAVELTGPDIPMLVSRNGELLLAIEHIAAKLLRLEPEQHDLISFDAGNFKAERNTQIQSEADAAILRVQQTGKPYSFPPMTSRERRMLHLALQPSGLPTASSGENPRRFVVLYPADSAPEQSLLTGLPQPAAFANPAITQDRTHHIRSAFRRR